MNRNQLRKKSGGNSLIDGKEKGIKEKIQSYMNSVTIDVFGYESVVNASIAKYAENMAAQYGVCADQVYVRIIKPQLGVRVFLHINGQVIKELTVAELVAFFVGCKPTRTLQDKVVSYVVSFLQDYSSNKCKQTGQLQVLISSRDRKSAHIRIFDNQTFIECIPVKTLIKFFKA